MQNGPTYMDEKQKQLVRLVIVAVGVVTLALLLAARVVRADAGPLDPAARVKIGPVSWEQVTGGDGGGGGGGGGGDIPEMAYVAGVRDDRTEAQAFSEGAESAMEKMAEVRGGKGGKGRGEGGALPNSTLKKRV